MPPPRPRRQPTPPSAADLDQLRERLRALEADKVALQGRIDALENARLRVTPEVLVRSLRTALDTMRRELAGPPEATVEYTVSGFDVDLKAGVETDETAGVRFRLPETPGPAGEALSTLRFAIQAVPKPRAQSS